ncbi:MAG: glyoxylate/hydroxypyruvate reductase A [bacterium]|nr:glyoxylate/hydroxypyruvate reductase A [bacterium]
MLNPYSERAEWLEILTRELPDMDIQLWPDIHDPDSVEFAVFWVHDTEDMRRYPNLLAILATTAGVEQFAGGDYPDVPIVRMADPTMAGEMAAYASHWVVHFHRKLHTYLDQQAARVWRPIRAAATGDFPVGILGFGAIGRHIGNCLAGLGYPINAWTRTGGEEEGITHYRGRTGLEDIVCASRAVVNVLPYTRETRGLIDAGVLARFAPGSVYISLGRGATTIEADLVAALDQGVLSAAVLDVTETEPLPSDSTLWDHPRVRITPHTSGFTRARTAAPLIAANIRRIQRGEPPFPLYDPRQGY